MNRALLTALLTSTLPFVDKQFKGDANETMAMAKSLEHYFAKVYETKYPPSKGRLIVPIDTSVPSGAQSHTYRESNDVGEAKVLASYAEDVPMVNGYGTEQTEKIIPIADGYYISIQDLRAAALMGQNIDERLANQARKVMERTFDNLLAIGSATHGMTGFANNANVPVDPSATTGGWDTASSDVIQADLEVMAREVFDTTKGAHGDPDVDGGVTLVLPSTAFSLIAGKRLDEFHDTTILEWAKSKLTFIKEITSWGRLDTAGASSATRAVAFAKDPDVVSGILPQDFEQMPPQPRGLGFQVSCHMRFGGVVWRYPLAGAYFDGL
jgi:hypothetical protein